jgi:hypothetical protein
LLLRLISILGDNAMKELIKQLAIILVFGAMLGLIVWGVVASDEVIQTPVVEILQERHHKLEL